ncbi:MAG: hypothetical protein ACTSSG_04265 [Candidatus Heimdallarchaeaceae archaeon]
MKLQKQIIFLFLLMFLGSQSLPFVTAQQTDSLIYMSGFVEDGGIVDSIPVLDSSGGIHIFFRVRSSTGDKLVHMFYENNKAIFEVIEDLATGIEIVGYYSSEINVGIVYSKTTTLGSKEFYNYFWLPGNSQKKLIFTLLGKDLPYIQWIKAIYHNGFVHVFYNQFYGGNNEFMNITHYFGFFTFKMEYFNINAKQDPLHPQRRDYLDLTIDQYDQLWYVWQLRTSTFGIGIGLLENHTLVPLKEHLFSDVIYDVKEVNIQPGLQENLSIVFTNPNVIYWGFFNGTHVLDHSQTTFFSNPIDITYKLDGANRNLIVADYQEQGYVNLYFGSFDGNQWSFVPISSIYHVYQNHYSAAIINSEYFILYNSTINPNDFKPSLTEKYYDDQAIGLFFLSSMKFSLPRYIEDLATYKPIVEFIKTKWYIFLIILAIAAVIVAISLLVWKKKKASLATFLFDEQVGKHSKFLLVFKNIWRFISNSLETIFTMWFSNKKRSILTLAGFIITGYLLSSAFIIAQSEESAMVKAFYRSFPFDSDVDTSVRLVTSFRNPPGETINVSQTYGVMATEEVLSIFSDTLLNKYIVGVEAGYYTTVKIYAPGYYLSLGYRITALPDDSYEYLTSIVYNGTPPVGDYDVIISDQLSRRIDLEINNTLNLIGSAESGANVDIFSMNVSGIFAQLNIAQIRKLSSYLNKPNDIYQLIEHSDIITTESNFFRILSSKGRMNLNILGFYQIMLNFDQFTINDRTILVEEQKELQGKVYTFSFDSIAAVTVSSELELFFENFNTYYLNNMARLLIFAIPAILLSIFMVFESSELFSSSYENEITILRDRGIPNSKITSIYIIIRLFEIIIASLLSFFIAVGTAIPLIKINGFISFRNTDTHLIIGNIGLEIGLVMAVLLIISIPRILIIVRRKKKIEKAPSTIKKILSYISWRDLFFITIGVGLFIYFYNQSFIAYYQSDTSNFVLFLFLTITGAVFSLLGGLPIVIKLLSMIWKIVGFVVWKAKKTKTSFTFSEISKDIRYFENITLIFLLVVSILLPVLIVPYSKETTLTQQAYFINGSELKIENWNRISDFTIGQVQAIKGVARVTNVRLYTLYSGTFEQTRVVVINTTDFTETVKQPSKEVSNLKWGKLDDLTSSTIMMSEPMLEDFYRKVGDTIEVANPDNPSMRTTLEIVDSFDMFPVYYFQDDLDENEYMVVVSYECWEILQNIMVRRLKKADDLFIRTINTAVVDRVKGDIFESSDGLIVKSYKDIKDSLKTPLYNIFVIEMLLSLFVSAVVLVFSSFTTAIKILEKRVIKHDIMKKMGINVQTIINMSSMQTMISAILPSLLIGSIIGFLVIRPTLEQLSYGAAPYRLFVNYPVALILLIFLGIPVLVYLGLNYFLKREFEKYAPTMMD